MRKLLCSLIVVLVVALVYVILSEGTQAQLGTGCQLSSIPTLSCLLSTGSGGAVTIDSSGDIATSGTIVTTNTTASTTNTTGAIVSGGGLGVAGSIYAGSTIYQITPAHGNYFIGGGASSLPIVAIGRPSSTSDAAIYGYANIQLNPAQFAAGTVIVNGAMSI